MDVIGYALAMALREGSPKLSKASSAWSPLTEPAVPARSGSKMLFTGGSSGVGSATTSSGVLNPTTETWSSVASWPGGGASKSQNAVTRPASDTVHVFSGYYYNGNSSGDHHAFDIAAGTWTAKASSVPGGDSSNRFGYRSQDDAIWGFDVNNALRKYNVATNAWTTGAQASTLGVNLPTSECDLILASDGLMYIYSESSKAFQSFDPVASVVTAKAQYSASYSPTGRGVETWDGLLMWGSDTQTPNIIKPKTYNRTTNTWDKTSFSQIPGYTPYPNSYAMSALPDGRVWVGAGSESGTYTGEGFFIEYPRPASSPEVKVLKAYLASK